MFGNGGFYGNSIGSRGLGLAEVRGRRSWQRFSKVSAHVYIM